MKIFFDVTDVVEYAKKNNTVIGIPRVQLNIISLLARKHSGATVRCIFFDTQADRIVEFDPAAREAGYEFDGERLLIDLGLLKTSSIFPSKVQIKSFLKRFNNKTVRSIRKADVYISALFLRSRLNKLGFNSSQAGKHEPIPLTVIRELPPESTYVLLGAVWWFPQIWEFAAAHRARGGRVVQMVYDLIPLVYPEYYTPREPPAFVAWLNRSLDYADRFICISEWTAQDLSKYAASKGKTPLVRAVPLAHEFVGFNRTSRVTATKSTAELTNKKFVLCVGTIEHRKNNIAMLKIWRQFLDVQLSALPLLVFAGKFGKGSAEFQAMLADDPELAARVVIVHAPSDHDLAWLYQNCAFSAYPSQFEGWGLPVGEAAWFGKYCVASSATSIPEVCGDLIDYVDPNDTNSIKSAVQRVITDEGFLRQRESRIVGAKLRTWENVADGVYDFVSRD